jgi:hypothetical protein
MITLQVATIETNSTDRVLAMCDSTDALTSIQSSALLAVTPAESPILNFVVIKTA